MNVKNCQIQTPPKYVKYILDEAGYTENIVGKRVLENSFGEGNFLVEIVRRYILDAKRKNYTDIQIVKALERDSYGYEIDSASYEKCIERLEQLRMAFNVSNVKWQLYCEDFLGAKLEKYDFIIGNPPYITYHNLSNTQRDYLKTNFLSCQKGRFDYFYAFTEKSIQCLKPCGMLTYLIPYGFITNKFAANLRSIVKPYLRKIVDYRNVNVFPTVLATPILLVCQKCSGFNYFFHEVRTSKSVKKVNKYDSIKLGTRGKNTKKLYGIEVRNSIATLKNEVFLFEESKCDKDFFYLDSHKIERAMVRNAVSPKSLRNQKKMKIIFPYKVIKGQVIALEEEELRKKYAYTYQYLLSHKELLCNRSIDGSTKWYEFGRRQALKYILLPKLVMPNVITGQNQVYFTEAGSVPYAGIFITLTGNSWEKLLDIRNILESKPFFEYIRLHSTPTTGKSFRISVNDVREYLCNLNLDMNET